MNKEIELKIQIAKLLPERIWIHENKFLWQDFEGSTWNEIRDTEWLQIVQWVEEKAKKQYGGRSIKNLYRDYLCHLMEICNPGVKLWDNGTYLGTWGNAIKCAEATLEQELTALEAAGIIKV